MAVTWLQTGMSAAFPFCPGSLSLAEESSKPSIPGATLAANQL